MKKESKAVDAPPDRCLGAGIPDTKTDPREGKNNAQDDSDRSRGSRSGKGRGLGLLRRSRSRDQPVLLRLAAQRQDRPHPGAPRRRRVAHGRRLYPRRSRQYRRLRRHLGPGRHRHDHRPVFRPGRQHPDPLHHRPGAARPAAQGRLPGDRYRSRSPSRSPSGRPPCCEPALVPFVFQQAFHIMRSGRPGPGADRPAVRRPDGGDRVRHRHLPAAAGLQARRDPRADRKSADDAERGGASADRLPAAASSMPMRRRSLSNSPRSPAFRSSRR